VIGEKMGEVHNATYKNGTLVLDEPLSIAEGKEVKILIIGNQTSESPGRKVAERLAEIAALPLEGKGEKFSGRDHDRILYGAPEKR
jgi:predicted DNA-binding antitoxin AbrB/MazE fold protein